MGNRSGSDSHFLPRVQLHRKATCCGSETVTSLGALAGRGLWLVSARGHSACEGPCFCILCFPTCRVIYYNGQEHMAEVTALGPTASLLPRPGGWSLIAVRRRVEGLHTVMHPVIWVDSDERHQQLWNKITTMNIKTNTLSIYTALFFITFNETTEQLKKSKRSMPNPESIPPRTISFPSRPQTPLYPSKSQSES